MNLKIKIKDSALIEDFLSKEKFQRTSGRGSVSDSWIIANHLKEISEELFDLDISASGIIGVHLFINGDHAIVSGANFSDITSLKNLSGKSFSGDAHGGKVSFEFGAVIENFKLPVTWVSKKTSPLTFFLNSVVFDIKNVPDLMPDFYTEITQNLELLKSLGRPILANGEPALDSHMMDFLIEVPSRPTDLKTNIAKVFASIL